MILRYGSTCNGVKTKRNGHCLSMHGSYRLPSATKIHSIANRCAMVYKYWEILINDSIRNRQATATNGT